ncbi:MAG: hypothetical protein ACFFFK_10505 [Candidatus Thorarchaeota archaeon]
MDHDQADTKSENEHHEILHEQVVSEKPKKVRKPQAKKEGMDSSSELPLTASGFPDKPKKTRKPSVKKETLESSSELSIAPNTDTEDTFRESSLEDVATESEPIQNKPISVPEEQPQPTTVIEKEDDTSLVDEDSASQEVVETSEATSEESDIPPIHQIRNLLTDFEMRVPVWGLTVFTVDGYILAHRLFYDKMPENLEMIVSSMSAGLITISQDFIRLVASTSSFRQVLVDADDESGDVSFSVLLKQIAENVMLTCIFPNTAKLGLVSFEIENLSNDINEIVKLWDVKLHEETVT